MNKHYKSNHDIKRFKHFLFILPLIFLWNSHLFAQANTSQQKSTSLKGKVTVCNIVEGGNVQAVSEDAPIILYITDSVTSEKVQLVFSKKVRKKFSYDPEKKLPDHHACISGKITEQNGSPAIIVTNEKQIKTSDLTSAKK